MKSRKPSPSTSPATDWGIVADWYDQLVGESGSEYHRQVVLPGVLRLLALQAGEKAIGVRIPAKLTVNSRKEARIAIYRNLFLLYHAPPKSVNGG